MNHVSFDRAVFDAFRANDRPGPIQMLNLVRLRDRAVYEDGSAGTGVQAYATYGQLSAPVLRRVGGHVVWRGAMEQMVIGPSDTRWDLCFIVQYPAPGAFLAMVQDDEYRKAVVHRQAAVEDSRLIRLAPLDEGGDFSGDRPDPWAGRGPDGKSRAV